MSTLETAESVLGISDRGADRLEDEMDYVEVVGDGAGSAIGGASGLSFLDVDVEDEVRVSSVLLFPFSGTVCPCLAVCLDVFVLSVNVFLLRLFVSLRFFVHLVPRTYVGIVVHDCCVCVCCV